MFTFLKSMRLRRGVEIKQTLDNGRKVVCDELVLFFRERDKDDLGFRFGVIVSKKTSRLAVERNRIKRALREGYRLLRSEFESFGNYDVVVISRVRITELSASEINNALRRALQKAEKKTKQIAIQLETNDTSIELHAV